MTVERPGAVGGPALLALFVRGSTDEGRSHVFNTGGLPLVHISRRPVMYYDADRPK